MHKEFRGGGGSKGVLGVGSKVQFWGPISLCLCAFLGLDLCHVDPPLYGGIFWAHIFCK